MEVKIERRCSKIEMVDTCIWYIDDWKEDCGKCEKGRNERKQLPYSVAI